MSELGELCEVMGKLRGDLLRQVERYRYEPRGCDEIARTVEAGITHLDAAIEQIRDAATFVDWEDRRREAQE